MPNIVGKSYAEAKNALLDLGIKASQIQLDSDSPSASSRVYAQYPYAGTSIDLAAGTTITLYLANPEASSSSRVSSSETHASEDTSLSESSSSKSSSNTATESSEETHSSATDGTDS